MAGTNKNTSKIHIFNLEHVSYNDCTKQTEERFKINKNCLKMEK